MGDKTLSLKKFVSEVKPDMHFYHDKRFVIATLRLALVTLFMIAHPVNASDMKFPDSAGKIVAQDSTYIIRLVETPGCNIKTAEAIFYADGSPSACNAAIIDFEHYPEFMPNITSARFVSKREENPLYEFCFKAALWTVCYTDILSFDRKNEDHYIVKCDFIEGDIKDSKGSWDISRDIADSSRTRIYYKLYIDTGMFVPRWVCDILTTKSIPKMIVAIRNRIKRLP